MKHSKYTSSYFILSTGLALVFTALLSACSPGNSNYEYTDGEPEVATDGQGNFMATWESNGGVWSRYYDQGIAQQAFSVAYGEKPDMDMSINGDAYVTWQEDLRNRHGEFKTYVRHFNASSSSWDDPVKMPGFEAANVTGPDIDVYDNLPLVIGLGRIPPPNAQTRTIESAAYAADDPTASVEFKDQWVRIQPLRHINPSQPKVAMSANYKGMMVSRWTQRGTSINSPGIEPTLYVSQLYFKPVFEYPFILNNWVRVGRDISSRYVLEEDLSLDPDIHYDLAAAPNGNAIVAWTKKSRVGSYIVTAASYDAKRDVWTKVVLGAFNNTGNIIPVVSIDDTGSGYVAWSDPSTIRARKFTASTVSNGTWSQPDIISSSGSNFSQLDFAMAANGIAKAVWSQDNGIIQLAEYDGSSWSTPTRIGTGKTPKIAVDNNANCLAAWVDDGLLVDYICNAPVASFSFSPNSPNVNEVVNFDASGSTDDGNIVDYRWDFDNDGTFDFSGITASHAYPASGSYTVRLRVTNDRGFIDEDERTIEVNSVGERGLTVIISGNGHVTSSPGGIDCGTDCNEQYSIGTNVTLTAVADTGATFTGWSGDCTAINNTFSNQSSVTVNDNSSCTATFVQLANNYNLTVNLSGEGFVVNANDGSSFCATESPPFITACRGPFPAGTVIELQGMPVNGGNTVFTSGCDSIIVETGNCQVILQTNRTVDIILEPGVSNTYTLTTEIFGFGSVSNANDGNYQCVSLSNFIRCTHTYPRDTIAVLNSLDSEGFPGGVFTDGCENGVVRRDCTVTLDTNRWVGVVIN